MSYNYDTEAKALFSHRADIKAKRNYIRIRQREKARAKANRDFAIDMTSFLLMIAFMVFIVICCFL